MKSFISAIKNNLVYILIPIIFVSFLLININVVYFGDDYYYLTFRDLEISEYFTRLAEHYCKDNGRFIVHMLATIFLKLPMPFWQVLNSLMLTGICYFAAKILTNDNKNNLPLLISIMFLFISFLDISITRQSTYWLTGSFNYIYPIFLLFIYWFCLTKIDNKNFFIAAIIVGLLAAATMEQSGMMAFGLTILTLLSKFKNYKELRKNHLFNNIKDILKQNNKLVILSIVTLIGLSSVILAPAQFVRIGLEETEQPLFNRLLTNSEFLLDNYTKSYNILPYSILFSFFAILYAQKNIRDKKTTIIISFSILNIIFNLVNISIFAQTTSNIIKILIGFIIIFCYFIASFYINKHLYKKLLSPLTIPIILMLGSQGMMLISPVFGPRNLIFGLIMFAFTICLIASKVDFKLKNFLTSLLVILALIANVDTANGYKQTKIIDKFNLEILTASNTTLSNENSVLTLYKFPDDNYGWSMPYLSSYHEFYFKHLHQIKNKIQWEYPEITDLK